MDGLEELSAEELASLTRNARANRDLVRKVFITHNWYQCQRPFLDHRRRNNKNRWPMKKSMRMT
ncbi:hypothetical protein A2U01_0101857 [Trifolium medium]|uniref:Uncharacterized protein n=1 Tax=Trifolium medium TaxID=97028 RepID=A0A392UX28_9FABA|nr:hypothetical protein [Trifolium medium]